MEQWNEAGRAPLGPTARSALRRLKERGTHRRDVIDAILDEGLVCHVAFSVEGQPVVLPMAYGRHGDCLYLHGAPANHLLGVLGQGAPACLSVTLVDALVLSRSWFHHSLNYRSVVLFGRAETVSEPEEARQALTAVVEHIVPGRSADARPPTPSELRATQVVRFPIEEGSAKVRTGGPKEEPGDLVLDIWGGELPLHTTSGPPLPDGQSSGPQPKTRAYLTDYRRPPRPGPTGEGAP